MILKFMKYNSKAANFIHTRSYNGSGTNNHSQTKMNRQTQEIIHKYWGKSCGSLKIQNSDNTTSILLAFWSCSELNQNNRAIRLLFFWSFSIRSVIPQLNNRWGLWKKLLLTHKASHSRSFKLNQGVISHK
jgi:hypothetical protein